MTVILAKSKLMGKSYKWKCIHIFLFLAYLLIVNAFDTFIQLPVAGQSIQEWTK